MTRDDIGQGFPDWAPAEIVALCEPREDDLRFRLLTHDGMQRIWQLVRRHNPGEPGFVSGPIYFVHAVRTAVRRAGFGYLSKGETIERTCEILKLTKRLSKKIRTDIEVDSTELYLDILPSHLQAEFIGFPCPAAHPVSTLLDRLAGHLEARLDEQRSMTPILPYPGTERAREIFFIREMGAFFKTHFGRPYYERLAFLTRAALSLDEDLISASFVRQVLRVVHSQKVAFLRPKI
jgi:hypothetical protein